jgi:hypothetical protein
MFTLIRAKADGDFGGKVTRARNHQNPVEQANFAALDSRQELLRQDMAVLGYEYRYRPEAAPIGGGRLITLEEVVRALALMHRDTRYPVRLKADASSLLDPYGATYKELFAEQTAAALLINAVQCVRIIRQVLGSAELSSAGQERLVYRHGVHCVSAVMMKRLSQKLKASAAPLDVDVLAATIGAPLDALRQQAFDLFKAMSLVRGPLAFFRNQTDAVSFQVRLMTKNFGLEADAVVDTLGKATGSHEQYPRQKLTEYLVSKAPQA